MGQHGVFADYLRSVDPDLHDAFCMDIRCRHGVWDRIGHLVLFRVQSSTGDQDAQQSMKNIHIVILILGLSGCYSIPEIDGFDESAWNAQITDCDQGKVQQAEIILDQQDLLLGEGQAEIKTLLGQPSEHELYRRNQKFFYYDLTPQSCTEAKRLSIRFDALDRVKEVLIIEMED